MRITLQGVAAFILIIAGILSHQPVLQAIGVVWMALVLWELLKED